MNSFQFNSERGGARLKLIVFLAVFAVVLYIGYLYIPVAVDAYYYKDIMQNMVNQGAAQGSDPAWVKNQLVKNAPDYHVPPDATITTTMQDKRIQARVQYTRPIVTPIYTYNYEFDYTAASTTFLTK
jgi:hypothetical protein